MCFCYALLLYWIDIFLSVDEAILMSIDFVGSIQTALPITWFSFFPFNARRREVATAKDQARRSRENAEKLQAQLQRGAESEHAMAQDHIEKMQNVSKKLEKSKEQLLHQRESEVASLAKQRQESSDVERRLRTKCCMEILVRHSPEPLHLNALSPFP